MAVIVYDGNTDRGFITVRDDQSHDVFQFQHGPVQENGVNGFQNEDVIQLLILRLRNLNLKFQCRENSLAITKLEEALFWLQHRTTLRVAQGVEGKNVAHDSEGGA